MKRIFKTFEEERDYLLKVSCSSYACLLNWNTYLYLRVYNGDTARVYCSFYKNADDTYTLTGGMPQTIKFSKKKFGAYITYRGRRIYLDRFYYTGEFCRGE